MMNYQNYDNKAKLIGKLEAPFKYGYEIDGKVFYLSTLLVRRVSGTYDRIPLCISENKLKQFSSDIYEEKVLIEGFIISYRNVNNNLKVKVRINNMLTMPEESMKSWMKMAMQKSMKLLNFPFIVATSCNIMLKI